MSDVKDEEILFPDQEIGGITVKPWSFGALFSITDPLERILNKIDDTGLAEKLFLEKTGNVTVDYISMARLFTLAGTELLQIMTKTLKVDQDTVEALSIEDGIKIVMLMYMQNKTIITNALKNAFSPPQTTLEKKVQEKKERGQKDKKMETKTKTKG